MNAPKVPAAVVWLERLDGRVLALTRKDDYADWHLPGGKWEPRDGYEPLPPDPIRMAEAEAQGLMGYLDPRPRVPNLATTAIRELQEETGIWLRREHVRPIHDYVTRSGRPVRLFVADYLDWLPERFAYHPAGQPAWVPPEILTLAWASFAHEARIARVAVARDRERLAAHG